MNIVSVATAFPEHTYDQQTITAYLERMWADHPETARRVAALHRNCGVESRDFVLPLERYGALRTFGQFNDEWIAAALPLAQRAIDGALARAHDLRRRRRQVEVLVCVNADGRAGGDLRPAAIRHLRQ